MNHLLPRADDSPISHPFKSACKVGCPYSCINKPIYIFSSEQAYHLREYAISRGLLPIFREQYRMIKCLTNIKGFKQLDIACPFMDNAKDSKTYGYCTIHNMIDGTDHPRRIKPECCVVGESPSREACIDPTKFPEEYAKHNNSLLPVQFDIVKELRAAVLDLPDNELISYGGFIDDRREYLAQSQK